MAGMKKPNGICDIQGSQPTDQQLRIGDTPHDPDEEQGDDAARDQRSANGTVTKKCVRHQFFKSNARLIQFASRSSQLLAEIRDLETHRRENGGAEGS